MKRAFWGVLLLVVVASVVGLGVQRLWSLIQQKAGPAVRVVTPQERLVAGKPAAAALYAVRARFQHALYFLPRPKADPKAALERLLPTFPSLVPVAKGNETPTVSIADIGVDKYAPPNPSLLAHAGVGLTDRQVNALQESREVFVLNFSYRPSEGFAVVRDAQAVMLQLAQETGALIWDEETRQCFAPDAWKSKRVGGWDSGLPELPNHFTIHLYRNGDFLRAITLGMEKFGLPDVMVNDLSAGDSRPAGNLINLACQTMAEKGKLDGPGRLVVDVGSLKNGALRESLQKSFRDKATGKAELSLVNGEHEKGDSANRLYEIAFPREKGMTAQQAQDALLSSLFGASDAITHTKHDEELLAASARAKAKLPALAERFRKGLPIGERLLLKAPFTTDTGGTEWMWVEVIRWKGEQVEGVLQNDPFEVSGLKAGARVEFEDSVVFDYIHYLPDGHSEGNETGRIIQRRQGEGAAR